MRPLRGGDTSRRTDARPYATLDIETDGLRGALVYWTVTCEHGATADGTSAESLWRLVLSHHSGRRDGHGGRIAGSGHSWREHVWWAHNGGSYDFLYLLPPARVDVAARAVTVTPITRADAVIGWRVTASKHRTDLRDSYALLPAPLAALAEQLAPELPKLPAPFDADGRGFDPTIPAHRAYAARDSAALLAVLVRFRAILADHYGVLPSWSAASTALRAWRGLIPSGIEHGHPPPPAAALARRAYYGGMVPIRSTAWHTDLVTIDVNSMYPAVMRDGVPAGDCFPVRSYVPGKPGYYWVSVTVPRDAPWTAIPYRDPIGAIAWPTGRFSTAISSIELAWALDHGLRVDVLDGWCWSRLDDVFGAFVERYAALRAMGGAFSAAAKVVGNGLYGKFGSRPVHDDWRLSAERPGPDWWPPAHDLADDTEVERYRGLWVRRDQPLTADYLMPHWAAWITAGARLALTRIAEAVGYERIVYGDTDSLTFPAVDLDRLPTGLIGSGLGQAKVEHRWFLFRAHAPKVYEGLLADAMPVPPATGFAPGQWLRKAKGIPRRLVDDAYATGCVGWDSPNGSLQVLQGSSLLTPRTRALSSIAGSVAWREADDGTVRPVHLGST